MTASVALPVGFIGLILVIAWMVVTYRKKGLGFDPWGERALRRWQQGRTVTLPASVSSVAYADRLQLQGPRAWTASADGRSELPLAEATSVEFVPPSDSLDVPFIRIVTASKDIEIRSSAIAAIAVMAQTWPTPIVRADGAA